MSRKRKCSPEILRNANDTEHTGYYEQAGHLKHVEKVEHIEYAEQLEQAEHIEQAGCSKHVEKVEHVEYTEQLELTERAEHDTVVTVMNKQRVMKVSLQWKQLIRHSVQLSIQSAGFPYPSEVLIMLVGTHSIQKLNKQFRNKPQVTDVLSFPSMNSRLGKLHVAPEDIDPYTNRCFLGDIVICIPRMHSQALEYGNSDLRELAFLTIHGTLHLLGYDHETPADEKLMIALQKSILEKLSL